MQGPAARSELSYARASKDGGAGQAEPAPQGDGSGTSLVAQYNYQAFLSLASRSPGHGIERHQRRGVWIVILPAWIVDDIVPHIPHAAPAASAQGRLRLPNREQLI
jgi:hypothetical protein